MIFIETATTSFDSDEWTFLFRIKTGGKPFEADGTERQDVALVQSTSDPDGVYSVYTRNEIGYKISLLDLLRAMEEHVDLVA